MENKDGSRDCDSLIDSSDTPKSNEFKDGESDSRTSENTKMSSTENIVEMDEKKMEMDDGEVERMSYDEALKKYGTGRYQIMLFILLALVTWSTVFNNNGFVFIGAKQSFTCNLPTENWTESGNQSAQLVYQANEDECSYKTYAEYEFNRTELVEGDIKCTNWTYDQSEFTLTMISEFDINSCRGKWYFSVANSMFMVGFLIGCIVLADLSDRYGRNMLLLVSNIGMIISGVIAAFSVNFGMLVATRLILGIFTAGARNAAFVYVCEIVSFRDSAGMLHGTIYSIGALVVTAIAQLLPNWRHFQLACALCYVLYLPYFWLLPESPRWMLMQGRAREAKEYFIKSAKINKEKMPKNFEVYLDYQPKKEGNLSTLFKTPNVRKKTLIVCIMWFCVSAVFFGMNFNVGNLSGNIFTNSYLLQAGGVLEFLGILYIRLGRRPAISSAFLLAFVVSAILPVLAVYKINAGVIAMGMIGKLLIETNFEMIYIVTAELYPTSERVTALGLGSSLARVGGGVAPYLVLSNDLWPNLPYLIFGALSLIAGLFAVLLPETKGRILPDSLHQVETENPLSSCNCCKQTRQDKGRYDVDDAPSLY